MDKTDLSEEQKTPKRGLFSRLRKGLSKTHALINKDVGALLSGKVRRALDEYWKRYKSGEMEPRS